MSLVLCLKCSCAIFTTYKFTESVIPDSKVHGANMGALSAPCWTHEPCYQGYDIYSNYPVFFPTEALSAIVRCEKLEASEIVTRDLAHALFYIYLTLYVLFFFIENKKKIYLHFMSFLHIDMTPVIEILPRGSNQRHSNVIQTVFYMYTCIRYVWQKYI